MFGCRRNCRSILYVSDRVIEQIRPIRSGWRSMRKMFDWSELALDFAPGAKRFETGTMNAYGIVALGGALEIFLEIGAGDLENRVLALAARAADGLEALGFQLVSSRQPGETSGIVAAVHPKHDANALVKRLAQKDVVAAARLGRFRVSAHFYNSEEEIDRMLGGLAD